MIISEYKSTTILVTFHKPVNQTLCSSFIILCEEAVVSTAQFKLTAAAFLETHVLVKDLYCKK